MKMDNSEYEFQQAEFALVTAVIEAHENNNKRMWPGRRIIRYQMEDGSWAWIPGKEQVGETIVL